MRRNNKGYTLVELIIVIAILTIIAGIASIGLSSVLGTKVTQCTENIKNVINKVRISTMGREEVTLRFYQGSDDKYYAEVKTKKKELGSSTSEETTTEMVGKSGIDVKFTTDSTVTDPTDSSVETLSYAKGNAINISFDRSSGQFKLDGSGKCVRRIWVIKNSRIRAIVLYQETGKVDIET